jgi:hypothetical protein
MVVWGRIDMCVQDPDSGAASGKRQPGAPPAARTPRRPVPAAGLPVSGSRCRMRSASGRGSRYRTRRPGSPASCRTRHGSRSAAPAPRPGRHPDRRVSRPTYWRSTRSASPYRMIASTRWMRTRARTGRSVMGGSGVLIQLRSGGRGYTIPRSPPFAAPDSALSTVKVLNSPLVRPGRCERGIVYPYGTQIPFRSRTPRRKVISAPSRPLDAYAPRRRSAIRSAGSGSSSSGNGSEASRSKRRSARRSLSRAAPASPSRSESRADR